MAWVCGLNHLETMMSDKKTFKDIDHIVKEQQDKPKGLNFPCQYPLKAMGPNTERFLQEMLFIAQKHCPNTQEHHVRTNISKTGKYQSVTIVVEVDTRNHLHGLYIEIKAHKDVKWTL
jgi:putative lipoic acid-binding regulatory protein